MKGSVERLFTPVTRCPHCNNKAPLEVVRDYSRISNHSTEDGDMDWDEGDVYELLLCPACDQLALRYHYFHSGYMEPGDGRFQYLYPTDSKIPLGLPDKIKAAFEAALRVRAIDANAYAVLMGRVLEMVCEDRKATGKSLNERLKSLADKGEIPAKLVGVATSLKNLRNVGAHATLGELTPAEIPILDDLAKAILEYVYSAPHLADKAATQLDTLKAARKKKREPESIPVES